ncbi:MAG: hypothetical protein COW18_14160 [Zetaproteobacteria bacterium CG12_big_fil_rev_8_21_14_0_65_54_13]|nr:MAG: hypothetical protein COW18_14160 [Zetaproteobacteria bacterium CG12_big_fil_rev_8_21_14_0_65_54_13]
MSRWQTLKRQVLMRRVPHCLISWRLLLPGQGIAVQLHRKVLLGAWPMLPRWQWLLIFLYSALTWWLIFAWLSIFASLKKSRRAARGDIGISLPRQLFDLFMLAFAHGVPPAYYYQYQLYRQPSRSWLSYIFTHELSQWHATFLQGASQESLHLMQHKHDFAQVMSKNGIATVESIALFPKGARVEATQLFCGCSLLLKPEDGSRAEGILRLEYAAGLESYRLLADDACFESATEILKYIQQYVDNRDYLVQPLLKNSAALSALCVTSQLVTLRLVTGLIDGIPRPLLANLEVPAEPAEQAGYVRMLAVDIETGRLEYKGRIHDAGQKALFERLNGRELPQWCDALSLCIRAHGFFRDVPTIGWDVAFTDDGAQLLEGNLNWGVAAHQIATGRPLLESPLLRTYEQAMAATARRREGAQTTP